MLLVPHSSRGYRPPAPEAALPSRSDAHWHQETSVGVTCRLDSFSAGRSTTVWYCLCGRVAESLRVLESERARHLISPDAKTTE
jgi:hypothetical protein